jgi:hypothetical protein
MFKNLLGGLITTSNFSNPCPKFKIVTREEFASREVEEIHKINPEEEHLEVFLNHSCKHIEDSWVALDGEHALEPKIE